MKKLLLAILFLLPLPAIAADNAIVVTVGSGLTIRSKDIGAGVQSPVNILGDLTGTAIYGTAGTANANVITVQGIASGTVIPVSLTSTTITGTVAATQSGTWTVQPGNTANTTAWLVTGTGGTFPVTQATAASLNATVVGTGTFATQAAQSGTWNITNISGTISLPTGAATAAKQPALGTAGAASADVITVQGIASMTPLLANPGTAANWGVGTSSQNSATVANGQLALAQFNTTPTTITTGNMSPLQMDSAGKLLVNCTGCSSSSSITSWGGGTLGAMANYGTSPGAVLVPGVNAFVTNSNANGQATAANSSPVVLPAAQVTTDPCSLGTKTNLPISQNGTSSVQLIALSGSTVIYVCSLSLIAAGATTVVLTTGTGTACVTGNAAVLGDTTANIANGLSLAANGGLTLGNGAGTVAKGAASSELCMTLGTNVRMSGNLTYVQQ